MSNFFSVDEPKKKEVIHMKKNENETANTVGKRIRALRKQKGMNQEELSEKVYVKRYTIGRIESDKQLPDINLLKILAKALDTSINYLLYGESSEIPIAQTKIYELLKDKTNSEIEYAYCILQVIFDGMNMFKK